MLRERPWDPYQCHLPGCVSWSPRVADNYSCQKRFLLMVETGPHSTQGPITVMSSQDPPLEYFSPWPLLT